MIKFFSDSDCDMPRELIEKYDIGIIPFGISYGDEKFHLDFYELTPKEFHEKCRQLNCYAKTSQPTYLHYEEKMRPALEAGHDVICMCITSKFSGSYQSGVMAEKNLREEFPDRKIHVMDTRRCTVLHGYLQYQACCMAEDGTSFDEIVSKLESIRDEFNIYVAVDSLENLRKGGRLGKAGALAGSLLNIKPLIGFYDGELQAHSKVRGRKNAVAEIVKLITNYTNGRFDEYTPIVFHCDINDAANELKDGLQKNGFSNIPTWIIGPVVGTHLGPTGYAAVVCKKINSKY